jgi:hypothetical protein
METHFLLPLTDEAELLLLLLVVESEGVGRARLST